MTFECLEYSQDPRGVARVALNRPAVHNAFNQKLIDELALVFNRATESTTVRAVILEGHGKNFSAGADVEWMRSQADASDAENVVSAKVMAAMLRAIDECSKPVIGKIHGAALGGGSGLTAVVDLAVAHTNTLFGFTEVRLGILPAVISPFVVRKIGYSQARARFITGARFSAQEALSINLVHYVAEDLEAKVQEIVTEIQAGAPQAQAKCKKLLNHIYCCQPEAQADYTATLIAETRASPQGREGLSAFLEKRPPKW